MFWHIPPDNRAIELNVRNFARRQADSAWKRLADSTTAFACSTSGSLHGANVFRESNSLRTASTTRSIARSNALAFAFDGVWKPGSLRTNGSAEAWISSRIADGDVVQPAEVPAHGATSKLNLPRADINEFPWT